MLEFLIDDKFVCKSDRIAVGVSGGADSMLLLWGLIDKQKQIGFYLEVVHVNHNLRGKESDDDCKFVEEFCKKRKLPCKIISIDVKELKTVKKLTLEESARVARHKAFDDVMKKELMAARERIFNDASIPAADKVKTLSIAETEIVEKQVNKFREQVKNSTSEEEVKILNRAINKMTGKKIKDIRFHGQTIEQVERSVKVKKWLRAEINRREGVFKNFKKLSGLVFGLAILPFTCGLLNWAYPRFMEKFFPELCDAKKQAKAAKEAK